MSLFCLVHGSTQSAKGWDLLIPELEKRGHQTMTVDLPTNARDASATHYADVIVQALEGINHGDVVVVGHSASGMFIPFVAQLRPVRQLVFLAALIPQLGASIMDQFHADPGMFNPEWVALEEDPSQNEAVAIKFLFHDCSPEVIQWALTTRILMYAEQAMTEVFPLQAWPEVLSSYIVCTEDRTISPDWSRRASHDLLGIKAIELPGGHCPYLSRPANLADVLTSIL